MVLLFLCVVGRIGFWGRRTLYRPFRFFAPQRPVYYHTSTHYAGGNPVGVIQSNRQVLSKGEARSARPVKKAPRRVLFWS